jgi:hypothetical protein
MVLIQAEFDSATPPQKFNSFWQTREAELVKGHICLTFHSSITPYQDGGSTGEDY